MQLSDFGLSKPLDLAALDGDVKHIRKLADGLSAAVAKQNCANAADLFTVQRGPKAPSYFWVPELRYRPAFVFLRILKYVDIAPAL